MLLFYVFVVVGSGVKLEDAESCMTSAPKTRKRVKSQIEDFEEMDVSHSDIKRVYHDVPDEYFLKLRKKFALLEKNASVSKTLKIMVSGGSITAGMFCMDPNSNRTEKDCAWSHKLVEWLTMAYPKFKFELHNVAIRAETTSCLLSRLTAELHAIQPDVIMWDHGINDAAFALPGYQKFFHAYEQFVRIVSTITPETQILTSWTCQIPQKGKVFEKAMKNPMVKVSYSVGQAFADFMDGSYENGKCDTLRSYMVEINKLYKVPFLDFTALLKEHPKIWKCEDPIFLHPNFMGHQFIAYSYWEFFRHVQKDACHFNDVINTTLPSPQYEDIDEDYPYCRGPLLSAYTAFGTHIVPEHSKHEGWKLMEDVEDRPGWVSTDAGSEIHFPIKVKEGVIFMTFLRSSGSFGKARIKLNGHSQVLDSHWHIMGSQDHVVYLHALRRHHKNKDDFHNGWGLKDLPVNETTGVINATLTVEMMENPKEYMKFKILEVGSC